MSIKTFNFKCKININLMTINGKKVSPVILVILLLVVVTIVGYFTILLV